MKSTRDSLFVSAFTISLFLLGIGFGTAFGESDNPRCQILEASLEVKEKSTINPAKSVVGTLELVCEIDLDVWEGYSWDTDVHLKNPGGDTKKEGITEEVTSSIWFYSERVVVDYQPGIWTLKFVVDIVDFKGKKIFTAVDGSVSALL